jgi:hypothetical protein
LGQHPCIEPFRPPRINGLVGRYYSPKTSALDEADGKAYILPLLFVKRISDVWAEEHAFPLL